MTFIDIEDYHQLPSLQEKQLSNLILKSTQSTDQICTITFNPNKIICWYQIKITMVFDENASLSNFTDIPKYDILVILSHTVQ